MASVLKVGIVSYHVVCLAEERMIAKTFARTGGHVEIEKFFIDKIVNVEVLSGNDGIPYNLFVNREAGLLSVGIFFFEGLVERHVGRVRETMAVCPRFDGKQAGMNQQLCID